MTIICEHFTESSSVRFQYNGAENFVYAYPETNPPTPSAIGNLNHVFCQQSTYILKKYWKILKYSQMTRRVEHNISQMWTTWTQEMLWLIGNNLDYETAN